jgi:hypothetical protein
MLVKKLALAGAVTGLAAMAWLGTTQPSSAG